MLTSTHVFSLISFGQDAAPPETYAQVERIYLESIGLTARTETNEIAYWRDRYNRQFGATGDRLSTGRFTLCDADTEQHSVEQCHRRHLQAEVDARMDGNEN